MAEDSHLCNTPLHTAASFGQLDIVSRLLQSEEYDVNVVNSSQQTPLHIASISGHIEIVNFLVNEFNADMGVVDIQNNTPLLLAAENEHVEIAIVLILTSAYGRRHMRSRRIGTPGRVCTYFSEQQKMVMQRFIFRFNDDTKAKDRSVKLLRAQFEDLFIKSDDSPIQYDEIKPFIPVFLAAFLGLQHAISVIAEKFGGKNSLKNITIDGLSLLHFACFGGHADLVKNLVSDYHFDYLLKDKRGWSALHFAACGGDEKTVQLLITEYKLDCSAIGIFGETPLCIAVYMGNLCTIKILIEEFKCNPHIKAVGGYTVIHYACISGAIDAIEKLIRVYHVNPTAANDQDETPLHIAAFYGHVKIVRQLIIDHNCVHLVNKTNKTGYSPICAATKNGHFKTVQVLIDEFNCDPNAKRCEGWTILHYACQSGHTDFVNKLMAKYDLDLTVETNDGDTPLHLATSYGHAEIVQIWPVKQIHIKKCNKHGFTPLCQAARNGHTKTVEMLVEQFKCDPTDKQVNGKTLLHFACQGDHTKLVDQLIKRYHLDPSIRDDDGNTSFHTAVINGQVKTVRHLTKEHKVESHIPNVYNTNPLVLAILNGKKDMMNMLVTELNFDIHITVGPCGYSLVHVACVHGHTEIIKELVHMHNLSPNALDNDGNTPLHLASLHGKYEAIRFLISECNVERSVQNINQMTPLSLAAAKGHRSTVHSLIKEFNCNHDEKGFKEQSILHVACTQGYLDLVTDLITEYKLDPTATDSNGNTPLHLAVYNGHIEVVRYLFDNCTLDTSFGVGNHSGDTVLHAAAQNEKTDIVQYLSTKHKAEVESRNKNDNTPLLLAALHGHFDTAQILIDQFGCNPRAKGYKGQTLLHYTCKGEHTKLTKQLIVQYQLDPMAKDDDGNTPLHFAAAAGQVEMIKFLITQNTKVNCLNRTGWTPLSMAVFYGKRETVTILIEEFNSDVHVKDSRGFTLVHLACAAGHAELMDKLLSDYNCNQDVSIGKLTIFAVVKGLSHMLKHLVTKYKIELSRISVSFLLFQAASRKHTDTLKVLIGDFKCNPLAKDANGKGMLHYFAQFGGSTAIMDELVSMYHLDPMSKDINGNTPLHTAASFGQLAILKHLITTYKVDIDNCNHKNSTSLCLAAQCGQKSIVKLLIDEFNCNSKVKGYNGWSLLHYASCSSKSKELVNELISIYGLDPTTKATDEDTPLHVAAQFGNALILQYFITEKEVDISNMFFTLLCLAQLSGDKNTAELFLDIRIMGDKLPATYTNNQTLLHGYAYEGNKIIIVDQLIQRFNIDPMATDERGNTPLHIAASKGKITILEHLIRRYGAQLDSRNSNNYTPLGLAAVNGHASIVRVLIEKFNCDPHVKESGNATVLHCACQSGNTDLIEELTLKFSFDLSAQDEDGNSCLHVTAQHGHTDAFQYLISRFRKDELRACIMQKNAIRQSLLHMACFSGDIKLVELLLNEFKLPLLSSDHEGNTPLHIAAKQGNPKCVKTLLYEYNAPIHIKNFSKQTSEQLGKMSLKNAGHINLLFTKYMKEKGSDTQKHYEQILKLSQLQYQNRKLTRIFVLGHHGGGKSTLVDTLKHSFETNSWFKSRSPIEPHTAGIVQSVVDSPQYGRLLIHDFAGDSEYYSSHAAILKNFDSQAGSNVYIIVLKLTNTNEQIKLRFGYWLHFISTLQDNSYILPVGSHCDTFSNKFPVLKKTTIIDETAHEFVSQLELKMQVLNSEAIDCRKKDEVIEFVGNIIQQVSTAAPSFELTLEAKFLFGFLKKEFSEIPACSISKVLKLIKHKQVPLPREESKLYLVLKELYHTGLILMIEKENAAIQDCLVIFQLQKIAEELHKKLFSKAAKSAISSKINSIQLTAGLIPESLLPVFLPEHITKECLLHLQYCQELKDVEISRDFTLTTSEPTMITDQDSESESILFFPALCEVKKEGTFWIKASCAFGWYAICDRQRFEHFPIRFLQVLMMRIIHKFPCKQYQPRSRSNLAVSDSSRQQALAKAQRLNPGCQVWSTGLHWLMENGVEAVVDMIKEGGSKQLVVITRSREDCKTECATVLRKIVQVISETKVEFCHRLSPSLYLLHPEELMGDKFPTLVGSSMHRYSLEEVIDGWKKNKKHVLSADSKRSKPLLLRSIPIALCTHWSKSEC